MDLNLPALLIWILIFSIFTVGFLSPREKGDWYSAGLLEGFLISLFFEMFGVPLTIYVISAVLGSNLSSGSEITLLGVPHPLRLVLLGVVLLLIVGGILLVMLGWKYVHRSRGQLVTDGIYAHVRHPQYLGILMVTLGLFIWWPTIVTAVMFPILAFMYFRLAKREEKDLKKRFGRAYEEYCGRVNRLVPARKGRHLQ
ncbi:MAG: isoprenylcysteine carboxylmethyltransferase family protein [Thermoplasmata archaeon]